MQLSKYHDDTLSNVKTSARASFKRGPYAKGLARRKDIVSAAYDLYCENEERPSLRLIADRVGLTEPGVLHYFGSTDDLFLAVLQDRDERAAQSLNGRFEVMDYLAWTTQTPGLTRLFLDFSVLAIDPHHPAHEFMVAHHRRVAEVIKNALGITDEHAIRLLTAASEGLQIAWLQDRSIDVVAELGTLIDQMGGSAG